MKTHLTSFLVKATLRTAMIAAGLIMFAVTNANDGKQPSSVAVKGSAPVNYYQAFMIGVAVVYGICLIVRAKRRKRNSKITGQSHDQA